MTSSGPLRASVQAAYNATAGAWTDGPTRNPNTNL